MTNGNGLCLHSNASALCICICATYIYMDNRLHRPPIIIILGVTPWAIITLTTEFLYKGR